MRIRVRLGVAAVFVPALLVASAAWSVPFTVVGLGDSNTAYRLNDTADLCAGVTFAPAPQPGAPDCESGTSYLNFLGASYSVVDNRGVSSQTSSGTLASANGLATNAANAAIIFSGTVDLYFDPASPLTDLGFDQPYVEANVVANVLATITAVRSKGLVAFLILPPPINAPCDLDAFLPANRIPKCGEGFPNTINTRAQSLSLALASMANTQGVPYVDAYALLADPTPTTDEPGDMQYFVSDGLHLSQRGDELLAAQVVSLLNVAFIPEPATALLLTGGLVGLGVLRRRVH